MSHSGRHAFANRQRQRIAITIKVIAWQHEWREIGRARHLKLFEQSARVAATVWNRIDWNDWIQIKEFVDYCYWRARQTASLESHRYGCHWWSPFTLVRGAREFHFESICAPFNGDAVFRNTAAEIAYSISLRCDAVREWEITNGCRARDTLSVRRIVATTTMQHTYRAIMNSFGSSGARSTCRRSMQSVNDFSCSCELPIIVGVKYMCLCARATARRQHCIRSMQSIGCWFAMGKFEFWRRHGRTDWGENSGRFRCVKLYVAALVHLTPINNLR